MVSRKLYRYQFQPEGECAELVGISDLHYGSANFLEKKAFEHREYIQDSPDRWCFDLGDSSENAIKGSPGASQFQQTCPPREQRAWVREYYRPIRNKTIAVVASNHPGRSEDLVDWSPEENLVEFLGCAYIRWEGVLAITVGNSQVGQQYLIYTRHCVSNSSKKPQILTALINKSRAVQGCDAYWCAHCHQYIAEPIPAMIPDPRHGVLRKRDQWFLMGDSFMKREDGYAEQRNFDEPAEGQISLRLHKTRHEIEVVRLLY